MNTNQRQQLLLFYSSQADYWSVRNGKEAEEQYEQCLAYIRFLVTQCDTGERPVMNNGTGLIFPSL